MRGEQDRPMRLAITTRYRGATKSNGARILASCADGRIHVPWDYALDPEANHLAAARALVRRLEWSGLPRFLDPPDLERSGVFVTDGSPPVASLGRC